MKPKKISKENHILVDDNNKELHTIPTSQAKELLGVVDVEKKARDFATKYINPINPIGTVTCLLSQNGYEKGYTQCLEDNKEKQFTMEDIQLAIDFGFLQNTKYGWIDLSEQKKFIQSIQPKTEWEVGFIDGKLRMKK